eukprot:1341233-Amphidinium_carterae.1
MRALAAALHWELYFLHSRSGEGFRNILFQDSWLASSWAPKGDILHSEPKARGSLFEQGTRRAKNKCPKTVSESSNMYHIMSYYVAQAHAFALTYLSLYASWCAQPTDAHSCTQPISPSGTVTDYRESGKVLFSVCVWKPFRQP